ncbi:unnamed protein product [marine sediment metagenome]|uniref:Uncharacterized protein n=1 Tax=marine sediment metagenome TaxID=412755 RepID=X0SZF3_9ZZZZ
MEFKEYTRAKIAELAVWEEGMNVDKVSIAKVDAEMGSPKAGDMIARNPANHDDMWLVAAEYFQNNFIPIK